MPASLEGLTGITPRRAPYLPLPDELARFADRNPAIYRRHYERLLRRSPTCTDGRLPFSPSWNWAAFFAAIPWLFYRKMYLGGIILVAMPVFLDHILPGSLFLGSGFLIAITAGFCGKSWYVEHALRRIAKARHDFKDGQMREAFLARARGVSLPAGIFGGLIQIVTVVVVLMGLLPPNRF